MYDTRDLTSLLAVITEGSFDAAARALHVTPGAMSQRIKLLEEKTGQLLVIRGQPARPTPAGEILLRLAQQTALLNAETARLLTPQASAMPHLLTIAINQDSLATWFHPVFEMISSAKNLLLDLRCGDASQTGRLLRDGTAVAAILSRPEAIPGCLTRRLGILRYEAMATPAFIKRWFSGGLTAEAFAQAPILLCDRSDSLALQFIRRVTRKTLTPPAHYIPSSHDVIPAIRAGLGWTMLPMTHAKEEQEAGRLARLSRKHVLDVPLHWQVWSVETALIAQVTKAVIAAAKQGLIAASR